MIEVVAEADDTLTHKYLEGEALTTDGDPPRPPARDPPVQVRARPHRLGPQEQGRPADARRGHRVPAVAARRAADDRPQARARTRSSSAPSTTRSRCPASCSRSPPTRSSATSRSSGSTRARSRPARTCSTAPRARRSASGAPSRCTPTTARRSARSTPATSARSSGLKESYTGDTLCDPDHPILLETISFPEPVIEVKVEPQTKADQDKMGIALQRLAEEDPTFRVHTDPESGETLIAGMGELHLDVIVDRMVREFKVAANVGKPAGLLPRDDPPRRRGQRPVRPPDGRQGPVRPRHPHGRARREGHRLRVRRQDRRRHHPARVHARDQHGHRRGPRDRHLRRLPDGRRQGHRPRRLVPRGRLVGDGLQDRRLDGHQGCRREGQPGRPRAHDAGRGHDARAVHGRRDRRPQQPPRPGRGHGDTAARPRSSARSCRSPRCSATPRTCGR